MEFKTHDLVNTPDGPGKIAWPLNGTSYMITLDATGKKRSYKKNELRIRTLRPGLVRTKEKFADYRNEEILAGHSDPEKGLPYGIPDLND